MPERLQKLARKGRKKRAWERTFLKILAQSGNVTEAAEAVGLTRTSLYTHRQRHDDFSQGWDSALETFADGIEAEAIRRAVKGVTRYKFYKGKPILHPDLCRCGHTWGDHEVDAACREEGCNCPHFLGQPYKERERSDALLALLLKGLRSEKYRDNLGLSQEEIDQYIERRVAEMAEARANQIISRNGTAHPPEPPQVSPPPDPASASAAAGSPAQGQGSPGPEEYYSDQESLRPDWLRNPPPA
jgi:hypothetical protein